MKCEGSTAVECLRVFECLLEKMKGKILKVG